MKGISGKLTVECHVAYEVRKTKILEIYLCETHGSLKNQNINNMWLYVTEIKVVMSLSIPCGFTWSILRLRS